MRLQNSREAFAPVPDRCWLQTLPDDYGTGLLPQTVPAARLLELFDHVLIQLAIVVRHGIQ